MAETYVRYAVVMFRALSEIRSIVADYTLGTVIVLVKLALKGGASSRA